MATKTKRPPRSALTSYVSESRLGGDEEPPRPLARWPAFTGLFLSLAGLGVSVYLTIQHFDQKLQLACPANTVFNCVKVTTSSYSKILGVPVAVLGLVFFLVMLVLQLPVMWRSPRREIRLARLGWSIVGVGTALWLIFAELFRIHNLCIWCTSVHGISLLIFAVTAVGTVATAAPPSD